ncbi:hypothetical protein COOONC_23604 [Cooperia oncophora]
MIECDDFDLDTGFYLNFMHSLSVVAVPLNVLSIFCILYKSTKQMGSYKWYLLIYQLTSTGIRSHLPGTHFADNILPNTNGLSCFMDCAMDFHHQPLISSPGCLHRFISCCYHRQPVYISVPCRHSDRSFLENQQSRSIHAQDQLCLFPDFKFLSRINCEQLP